MEQKMVTIAELESFSEQTMGQDILRYLGLPAILGHEKDTLLYFLGRNLARKIEYQSIEDMIYIFHQLKWGKLELIKEKKNEMTFHLMADEIVHRLKSSIDTEFKIESGFIAESIQQLRSRAAECTESVNSRLYRIEFKVFFTD